MKPELLAPAGSPASLCAAVKAGADSVYMGSVWNARARALNFQQQELARAISYCHKNDVRAYIALNTLIFEMEMPQVAKYIAFAYENGADALIIQDLGVAKMAKEIAPDLPLHASTQLSVHNSKTACLLKKLGFSRIILARELSLEQAKKIRINGGIEVETFCHGALCYSYSGKCFFSLIQTKRSANRGACSQMCRFPWKLYKDGKYVKSGYLTSVKDLNAQDSIPQIAKAGISCVKIEGRLKDAGYVRGLVSAYRRALDRGETSDLSTYTSRGYTGGYLFGAARKEKLTRPFASSFSGELVGKVTHTSHQGANVRLSTSIRIGDFIRTSSSGKIIEIFRIYQKGKEVKSAIGECTLQIKTIRPGDSIFKVERAKIEDDFLKDYPPVKGKSAVHYAYVSKILGFPPIPKLANLHNAKQAQNNPHKAYAVPLERLMEGRASGKSPLNISSSLFPQLVIDTPRVAFDDELPSIEAEMRELSENKPFAFMASEPSLASGYPTIVSPYANVTNTLAARAWEKFGNILGIVPSLEIAGATEENKRLGFTQYEGYPIELMISENDLFFELGIEEKGEAEKDTKYELADPRGNRFRITRSWGRTVILKMEKQGGNP